MLLLIAERGVSVAQTVAQPLPLAPGPYRIGGTVVNAKTGSPLARASVQIQDTKDRQSTSTVITSDDGRFEFRVMAGKFGLLGAKHGFITSYYNAHGLFSSAIVTGADLDTEHLVLRLPLDAVLSGKVLDESGEPVRNAEVRLYREDNSSGVSRTVAAGREKTDDQGVYEMTPLAAGTYFVAVNATPWYAVHPLTGHDTTTVDPSLDVAYPITYYGDVTQPEEATPIPVRGGDRLEADIHLTPVAAVHLTYHSDGQSSQFPTLAVPVLNGFEEIHAAARVVSFGVYEINGFAPGRYAVSTPDASGQLQAPTEVNISGGQELDTSSARPYGEVQATARMQDGSKLPGEFSLGVRSSSSHQVDWERVNEKGQAEFSDLSPGRYDLLAGTSNRSYAVVDIASGNSHRSGKSLDVSPGAALEISATVVGGMINVEGLAQHAGEAAPGAMIVLVPQNPESNRELFRRDQSDLDGSFNLQSVIPGSYTVIAIDNGWDLDWAKSAVLARFLSKGEPVRVSDGVQGSIHLAKPVEVQKK
jgi:5-hydroxyisourate hydrolase-like protein (transthyretin family)